MTTRSGSPTACALLTVAALLAPAPRLGAETHHGFAGRVVSPAGAAIAEAEAHVFWASGRGVAWGETDRAGYFHVEAIDASPPYELVLVAGGFARHHARLAAASEELTITLVPAARVTGSLVDPAGAPIAGAQLIARAAGEETPAAGPVRRVLAATATSAADGTYLLDGLAAGPHVVAITTAAGRELRQTVVLDAGATTRLDIELP